MSLRPLGVVAVLGAAVILVALIGTGLGWWSSEGSQSAPSSAIVVRTGLAPSAIFFGDPIVAHVDVDLDTAAVSARTLRVEPSFEPFVESGAPTVARLHKGRLETVRYTYTIQCVTDGCLPTAGPRVLRFRPVIVTAAAGSQRLSVSRTWPAALVASRLRRANTAGGAPHFHVNAALPAPTFGSLQAALADIILVLGAIVAVGAFVLLGMELRAHVARRDRRARPTRLEAAVAAVRDAARRKDPGDRRKALEFLAETLEREGRPGLAESAGHLAWAEPPPTPERALELADAAETTPETVES
jgi:hypothetical protein